MKELKKIDVNDNTALEKTPEIIPEAVSVPKQKSFVEIVFFWNCLEAVSVQKQKSVQKGTLLAMHSNFKCNGDTT